MVPDQERHIDQKAKQSHHNILKVLKKINAQDSLRKQTNRKLCPKGSRMVAQIVNIYTGFQKMNRHIPSEGRIDTM